MDAAVEVHEAEPSVELAEWDHVTECGIDVPTGRVVVAGCTDYFPDAVRSEVVRAAPERGCAQVDWKRERPKTAI